MNISLEENRFWLPFREKEEKRGERALERFLGESEYQTLRMKGKGECSLTNGIA